MVTIRKFRRKGRLSDLLMLAPFALLFLVFTIFPVIETFRQSMQTSGGFVGLDHYRDLVKDRLFWNAAQNSALYVSTVVALDFVLTLLLFALLRGSTSALGKTAAALFLVPFFVSSMTIAIGASGFFFRSGLGLSQWLVSSGLTNQEIDWLGNPTSARAVVTAIGVWSGLPFMLGGFWSINKMLSPAIVEQARLDTSSDLRILWSVILPSSRSALIAILLVAALFALRAFDHIQVLTQAGPYFSTDIAGTYIYRVGFTTGTSDGARGQVELAEAAGFFFVALVTAALVLAGKHLFPELHLHSRSAK